MIHTYSQKLWSPNSPFGRENSVFGGREVASLCRRGKARVTGLADAMAALTGRIEPAKWTDKWLKEKFVKMGMPRKNGDMVLVFQGEFSQAVARVAMDEMEQEIADAGFEVMVDAMRGGKGRQGIAVWTGSPVMKSKTPGAPTGNVRVMQIRFKP